MSKPHFHVTAGLVWKDGKLLITMRPEGTHLAGYWEFPGGTPDTSREENPLILYDVPGKYDVTLTVIKGDDTSTSYMPEYITVNTTRIRTRR